MKIQAAFGLYSYSLPHPGDAGFKRFCDEAISVLGSAGLIPTFFGASGKGHKGEFVPISGNAHMKSMRIGFENADSITFACNPNDSDAPTYDSFASISLGFLASENETLLSFFVDDLVFEFDSEKFSRVMGSCLALHDWDFGYALSSKEFHNPEFYILSLDDGKLSKSEMDALLLWYNSAPEDRLLRIRDVHSINFINDAQLALVGNSGLTLRQIIESDGTSELSKISASLWRWDVPFNAIARLRGVLAHTGLTICGG